jgi:capsular exopolysaccharide synthesis family protein
VKIEVHGPGEGKSTTVINLGIVISQAHNRVLVIDCDLRKPVVHTVFGEALEPGMTNVLLGKISCREAVRPTNFEGLSIITGGTIPPNPTELLSSGKIEKILGELKKEFDYIFIDSPPVVLVSDAAILGRIVDGVFLVIECEKTTVDGAKKAKTGLETVHAKVLGAIFNNMKSSSGYGYYYYPYYYSYGSYGYYGSSGSKPQGWSLNAIIARAQIKLSGWFSSNPPK